MWKRRNLDTSRLSDRIKTKRKDGRIRIKMRGIKEVCVGNRKKASLKGQGKTRTARNTGVQSGMAWKSRVSDPRRRDASHKEREKSSHPKKKRRGRPGANADEKRKKDELYIVPRSSREEGCLINAKKREGSQTEEREERASAHSK